MNFAHQDSAGSWRATARSARTPSRRASHVLSLGLLSLLFACTEKLAAPETAVGAPAALDGASGSGAVASEDCSAIDPYSAALASFTIQCRATIDPASYRIDSDGFLRRGFEHCLADDGVLRSIDDLLGLQARADRLPTARACLAGRWQSWQKNFATTGIGQCPTWHDREIINSPSPERVTRLAAEQLERARTALAEPDGARAMQLEAATNFHENYSFEVSYDGQAEPAACSSAAECAATCAAGLPGFVLEAQGRHVLVDPTYWLLDTIYPSSTQDPFLKPGYYHPMSYYGPLPGAIFGHRNRATEKCSRYVAGTHYILPLKLDCLDTRDFSSCVSECSP